MTSRHNDKSAESFLGFGKQPQEISLPVVWGTFAVLVIVVGLEVCFSPTA
ncbi:MAG: hypothetical protein ACO1RA_06670 [Planctomycetaceae bacterium]